MVDSQVLNPPSLYLIVCFLLICCFHKIWPCELEPIIFTFGLICGVFISNFAKPSHVFFCFVLGFFRERRGFLLATLPDKPYLFSLCVIVLL